MGHPDKLVIKQQFSGIDEHGHLTIDTELEGRVPHIPFGSSVHIEPYTELYHYSRQGEPSALSQGEGLCLAGERGRGMGERWGSGRAQGATWKGVREGWGSATSHRLRLRLQP